ncbi:MAG: citronellol/citronellal dehydrogenase [Saprospiraceae bacterium]|jgi:citronellol/citronellal dehydrogenase
MYKEDLFKGKTALVTGGRSGIGYGIAKMYLQLGAKVIIASRKAELLAKAAKELSAFGTCDYKVCDIRKTDEIQVLADYIKKNHGVLDILVNNAGGQFPAPAELISDNGWAAVVNNNLNGTFYMSRIMATNFFIPQKHGNIVNILANIWRGFPGMAHTGAARAGVDNLTKTLAQEWAEYNIRVNAIAPGIIESSGLETYTDDVRNFFNEMREKNLMGRFGTVEDVANAVMFQSGPMSSYISGTTLYVDGMSHLAGDRMALYKMLKKGIEEKS